MNTNAISEKLDMIAHAALVSFADVDRPVAHPIRQEERRDEVQWAAITRRELISRVNAGERLPQRMLSALIRSNDLLWLWWHDSRGWARARAGGER